MPDDKAPEGQQSGAPQEGNTPEPLSGNEGFSAEKWVGSLGKDEAEAIKNYGENMKAEAEANLAKANERIAELEKGQNPEAAKQLADANAMFDQMKGYAQKAGVPEAVLKNVTTPRELDIATAAWEASGGQKPAQPGSEPSMADLMQRRIQNGEAPPSTLQPGAPNQQNTPGDMTSLDARMQAFNDNPNPSKAEREEIDKVFAGAAFTNPN